MDGNQEFQAPLEQNTDENRTAPLAAYVGSTLCYFMVLVDVFLQLFLLRTNAGSNQTMREEGETALSSVRKRKRFEDVDMLYMYSFRRNLKSFLLLGKEIQCEWYIKPRSIQWFLLFIDFVPREDPERFKFFFKMSPQLFYSICDMVRDRMITRPPPGLCNLPNRKLTVERQVAIALRRLGTGDQCLGISELFGLSVSTVIKVTWKFIQVVCNKGAKEIAWPTAQQLLEVKAGFYERGFPNCCGAVDGTHFPLELPRGEQSTDYYDFKHNISVSMQAIVDTNLRFLDICAGWAGSVQDSRLLRNSSFFNKVVYDHSRLARPACHSAAGTPIREYIIGDAGYPLYDWLIVPYARGLSYDHDVWNLRHSSALICVERAFGRLKGTWRILSRIIWKPHVGRVGPMIFCCCVLHNLMIRHNEPFSAFDEVPPRPQGYGGVHVPTREFFDGGPDARDELFVEVLSIADNRHMPLPPRLVPGWIAPGLL